MKLQSTLQVLVGLASMSAVYWTVAQDAPAPGTDTATSGIDATATEAIESPAPSPATTAVALRADGPAYPVSAVQFTYLQEHPDLPSEAELDQIPVTLLPTATGYVAPRGDSPRNVTVALGELDTLPRQTFHASAANQLAAAVVRDFNGRGIIGVLVTPALEQIQVEFTAEGTPLWGADLRAAGNTTLDFNVRTNFVSEMRTVASGDRIPAEEDRVNHPAHARILANSPLGAGDLVNRRAIDDYLYDLNRHPGRNAAVSVSTGLNPAQGDTVLDYLVSEAKPWTAFFNLSNTGTEDTNDWRERFGLLHTQFTGNDDILSLEYVTAAFSDSNAIFASYERPFASNDRVHWRIYGEFQDFEASDVGFPGADFNGTEYRAGGEIIHNFWQSGPSFLDFIGGARWESVNVDNQFAAIEETEEFVIPYFGIGFENTTQVNTTTAYFGIEFSLADLAGTDEPDIDGLGRLNTDADWFKFPFSIAHSFYLEPILNNDDWRNISTPGSTLAHEVFAAFRGQWVPDSRLNPQAQQVLGGLFTVRGYPEAITAGDTVFIATGEYRLHIPRLFAPIPGQQREVAQLFGEPFRTFPQEPYGSADWDVVAKAFVDVGRALNNDREFFEQNETLVGVGVGVDLLFKRNANFTIDYGVALNDAAGTTDGSQQFHFSFTLLY
ncbi:MAG: hypothetical protein AAF333_13920 [Planctomycetota bacterium]